MINKILLLAILSFAISCSTSMTFTNLYSSISPYFIQDNNIPEKYTNNFPYAFSSIRFGRGSKAYLVLASVEGDTLKWLSNDGVEIYTINGKIIKTIGLQTNINFINPNQNFKISNLESFFSEIILNRGTPIYDVMKISRTKKKGMIVEKFYIQNIKWNDKNIYYLDDNGRVFKSVNKINPLFPAIEMEFIKYHQRH